jgi:hypothetical protein|tara:strand:+ start:1604 stop:2086 length:483 start_codon:yes stop_codon:yes gene_type:complete
MERRKPLSPSDFIKYVAKPIAPKEMDIWVKAHNINTEKTQLFFDFIYSLSTIMQDTYLGKDTIVTQKDILGHFNWCWNKNLENFHKENITFKNEGEHKDYLWNFFEEAFYRDDMNKNVKKIETYLSKLFKLYIEKTKSELDMLRDIYLVLENALIIDNDK